MGAFVRRVIAGFAIVQGLAFVGYDARAQDTAAPEAPSPAEAAEAAAAAEETEGPLDAEGATRATWSARVEYHRQLRSTYLSEISSGAATLGYGIYSLTRDEPFSRGMGGAQVAAGGAHLATGIVFTILSQRALSPDEPPEEFRQGDPLARELEEAERRRELFIAYLVSDASTISGALTTTLVGIARDKAVTQGVGLGLATQGVLTLVLDLTRQSQDGAYLTRLRDLQLRVERPTAARGAIATFGWSM